jgi:CHAT domain-containing protein/uncharacterized protein associated with vWA-MoxR-VMAP ternary system
MTISVRVGGIDLQLPDGAQARDLSTPSATDASVQRRGRRPLPRGPIPVSDASTRGRAPSSDPIVESMQSQDMQVIGAFEVDLPADAPRKRGAPQPLKRATVQVGEDEDAVILLESDGVYEWRVEAAKVQRKPPTRRGPVVEPGRKTVTFELDVEAGGAVTSSARRKRGGPLAFVAKTVRGYVLKFVARVAVGEGIKFLERNARQSFVVMDGDDPSRWRPMDDLSTVVLPEGRPARILLFVHGTFSSTVGAFGVLVATAWGKQFLADALESYDLVIGYDHPTLSVDPLENAIDLLAQLERSKFHRPPLMDVVSHSRGALVVRSLVEHLLPKSTLGACVRRAVFVAGANGGTQFAEPDNWKRLIDLYTNIAVAAGRAIALLGAPVASVIVRETVNTLGTLVKHLATVTIKERRSPGLSAMEPDGDFVTEINKTQPGQPTAAESLFYVVTSDFEVDLTGAGTPELSTRLKQWIADAFVGQVFKEPNDLVVGVPSMSTIDPNAGLFVKDRLDFGTNPTVYHTVYFAQPKVLEALERWLELDPAQKSAISAGDPVAELGIAADTRIVVMRSEDPFHSVLTRIEKDVPQYVVVVRDNKPNPPYYYAFRAQELLDFSKKLTGRAKIPFWEALGTDPLLRLGEDSASGEVPLANPSVARVNFGNRGLTAQRTIVLDGTAPRAVIDPSAAASVSAIGDSENMSLGVWRGGASAGGAGTSMTWPGGKRRTAKTPAPSTTKAKPPSAHGPAVVAPDRAETGTFYFAAHMPHQVQVRKTTRLDVVLSRDAIEAAAADAVEARGDAQVRLERDLVVQLFGTKNLEVVGESRAVLNPTAQRRFDLMFQMKGTDVGDGEAQVLILQGVQKLATLVLRPQIIAKAPAKDVGTVHVQSQGTPGAHAGGDYPVLHIKEVQRGKDQRYEFFLNVRGRLFFTGQSAPLKVDRAAYVAAIYDRIEQVWLNNKGDVEAFEEDLRTYGAELYDELVPPEVQSQLWEVRDALIAILVVSEEPFIPWEIVHLKPSRKPGSPAPPVGKKETHFLAEKGLVRWLANYSEAPDQIRIRKGRGYYTIPDYPDASWKLPEAQKEIPFLASLNTKEQRADRNALRQLLSNPGAVDHFHFAGHGEAELQSKKVPAPPAKLMMLGNIKDAQYVPEYFESDWVGQHGDLSGPDGNRPLIVLNACQVGRANWKLTSVGGFAQAFLSRGAGAFVSTLWAVGDDVAHTFTECFYRSLLKGNTIAAAARQARREACKAREGTWLAYVVYGYPDGKVIWESANATKAGELPPASGAKQKRVRVMVSASS